MKLVAEFTEEDLKKLVLDKLRDNFPRLALELKHIKILVKSKQNYKSEWEVADFKASIDYSDP